MVIFGVGAVTAPGATTATDVKTLTGGVAGSLTGRVAGEGGGFSINASVGFTINTTGVLVKQSIVVGDASIVLNLTASPKFAFIIQNLDFSFGDILELRAGSFSIGTDGTFSGSGLELFIGRGPSKLADGTTNPAAVGVLIRNATIAFIRNTSGFALTATGTFAVLGLDGLSVSGTVGFAVNTASVALTVPGATTAILPGAFSFQATGLRIFVANVFEINGNLALTRQPGGDLDIVIAPAAILVQLGGTNIASLRGYASFTMAATTGFRLNSFKVEDFALFPSAAAAIGDVTPPTLFPTADLVSPVKGAVLAAPPASITVVFNDVNQAGLNATSILDAAPEFTLLVNGAASSVTVNGQPTLVSGNTYRYAITSGVLPANGLVTVRFLAGAFSDSRGATTAGEDEQFVLFTPTATQSKPGPIAVLASPSNGGTITVAQLNAQRYLDITYTSLDGNPINKASLEVATAPFTITGPASPTWRSTPGSRPSWAERRC